MSVTTNGKTLKALFADMEYWDNAYMDDHIILINGTQQTDLAADNIADNDTIEIKYGSVHEQDGSYIMPLAQFFDGWHLTQTHSELSVRVPNEKINDVIAMLSKVDGCIIENPPK